MSRFINPRYNAFAEYVPGEQPQDKRYIKLNTNESPYPPSPAVLAAVGKAELADLRLYSDPACRDLKAAIGERYGVSPSQVFVANGSDDILNFAFMAYSGSGKAYFPEISYGFYEVYAEMQGVSGIKIPMNDDLSINPARYANLDGLIAIANPNAPTGIALSCAQIESILQTNPDQVVLVDEAYVEFGAESMLPLLPKYENLLIVRTFSKSVSLAGARLGYAFGSEAIIRDLEKLKYCQNPYSINRLTSLCGSAAMREPEYYREMCEKIIRTRERSALCLQKLGFTVLPSKTNFVFAKHAFVPGETIYQKLKSRGILVRHFSTELIRDYNRISIGTDEDMDALFKALEEIIKEEIT